MGNATFKQTAQCIACHTHLRGKSAAQTTLHRKRGRNACAERYEECKAFAHRDTRGRASTARMVHPTCSELVLEVPPSRERWGFPGAALFWQNLNNTNLHNPFRSQDGLGSQALPPPPRPAGSSGCGSLRFALLKCSSRAS